MDAARAGCPRGQIGDKGRGVRTPQNGPPPNPLRRSVLAAATHETRPATVDMTQDDNQQDQPARRERRGRVLKRATIILGVSRSELQCTVRNQGATGAELSIAGETAVPEEFLLYVPLDEIAYRCVVRWRRNDRLGVEFTGREPKPAYHYG